MFAPSEQTFCCGFLQERRARTLPKKRLSIVLERKSPARPCEKSCGADVFVKQIRNEAKDFELQIIKDSLLF